MSKPRRGTKRSPSALDTPTTPLGWWMKSAGKTMSDLAKGADIAHPTARAYVRGNDGRNARRDIAERISAWTAGKVSVAQLIGIREAT